MQIPSYQYGFSVTSRYCKLEGMLFIFAHYDHMNPRGQGGAWSLPKFVQPSRFEMWISIELNCNLNLLLLKWTQGFLFTCNLSTGNICSYGTQQAAILSNHNTSLVILEIYTQLPWSFYQRTVLTPKTVDENWRGSNLSNITNMGVKQQKCTGQKMNEYCLYW